MWFNDEEVSGRWLLKKRRERRKPILEVNARLSDKKRARAYRVAVIILIPTLIVIAGALIWFGLTFANRLMFSQNDRFTIVNMDIPGGAVISRGLIEEYTQINKGTNLFAFNIREVREEFLARVHNVESMEISRHLPDTLKITIVERVPLACIGRGGDLMVDSKGYVFSLRTKLADLPVITRYRNGKNKLQPGDRIDGMALVAIEVLDVCESPEVDLRASNIDVGESEYIIIHISKGRWSARLAWEGMGEKTKESRRNLTNKLHRWLETLQTEEGRRRTEFDLTFDDKIFGE